MLVKWVPMIAWTHDPNLVKICFYMYKKKSYQTRSWFWACHDSRAVLSWHVKNVWPGKNIRKQNSFLKIWNMTPLLPVGETISGINQSGFDPDDNVSIGEIMMKNYVVNKWLVNGYNQCIVYLLHWPVWLVNLLWHCHVIWRCESWWCHKRLLNS